MAGLQTTLTPEKALDKILQFLGDKPFGRNANFEVSKVDNNMTVKHFPSGGPIGSEHSDGHYQTHEFNFSTNGRALIFTGSSTYTTKEQMGIDYKIESTVKEGPSEAVALETIAKLRE